jgi:hypothetical protein
MKIILNKQVVNTDDTAMKITVGDEKVNVTLVSLLLPEVTKLKPKTDGDVIVLFELTKLLEQAAQMEEEQVVDIPESMLKVINKIMSKQSLEARYTYLKMLENCNLATPDYDPA